MNLDRSSVERIAHLARLALAEEDVPRYVRDLSRILDLVERMGAVDTRGVEPMAHPLDIPQRLRPDEVTEEDRREELLGLAPQAEAGHFLVPKVID